MSQNINVDPDKLRAFTNELTNFHEKLQQRLQSLQESWETCSQSWQGEAKDSFSPGFESMMQETSEAYGEGTKAIEYLEDYNSLLEEFERR